MNASPKTMKLIRPRSVAAKPSVELTRTKYYVLMALFVLGEIPMNSLAFAVFGENQIFTWVMAVGVAVAIPWIAHAMGILFKRWSDPWWKNAIGIGSLLFLTLAAWLQSVTYVSSTWVTSAKRER